EARHRWRPIRRDEVVRQAQPLAVGLAREGEALDLALLSVGVQHDQVVVRDAHSEITVNRLRSQVAPLPRLTQHALQSWLELLADQCFILLAVRHAAPAPTKERVAVQARRDVLDGDAIQRARPPERRRELWRGR